MSEPQRYTVQHETRYAYTAPVSQSWQLARLTPRLLPWQRLLAYSLEIEPRADERRDEVDSFGNMVTHFGLHGAHRMLRVRMECVVEVTERPAIDTAAAPIAQQQTQLQGEAAEPTQTQTQTQAVAAAPLAWEAVREAIRREPQQDELVPASMSEPTPLVPLSEGARQYAAASFARGRPWLEALTELMGRIHDDFEFEPGATTVATSVDEVLYQKRGVCQDFAHLMLACLRGHGLPARYVSGYLLTDPPPGMARLMGADASHAWVAAYSPQHGWVEFDPTNNQLADQRYITLTWGADFADVVPLRGVILGGGEQRMEVEVSVIPA
ncbi:MAG TPA: transglutaminase family protein [Burkholderiaceae bacterium]|nr:transglutaminase family protein [Burkholderiaceae bacterium]